MRSGWDLARLDCRLVWSRDEPPLDAVRDVVVPGFELHDLSSPHVVTGPAGYRRYVAAFRSAIPDLTARVETAVHSEDWVFYRRSLRGTHRRQFMTIPASDERVAVDLSSLVRTDGGRVEEAWTPGWRSVARDLAEVSGVEPPPLARGADADGPGIDGESPD